MMIGTFNTLLSIRWDVTPEIIDGWRTPNYYGLLFVTGLVLGYFVMRKMFRKENIGEDLLDKLVFYVIIATIVGARLGHVLFYGPHWGPDGYFSHPLDIFKVWEGGLASHGGVFAIVVALIIYSKKVIKKPMLWIFDRMAISGAIGASFIRFGNLMNSEIVGDPTNVPWGFEFINYVNDFGYADPTPRHPAQLYEALSYLIIFALLMFMFWKKQAWRRPGRLFGTFLILLFGVRFLVEFVKLGQSQFDESLSINTGQWLSIPFVIAGIILVVRSFKIPRVEDEVVAE